MEAIEKTIKKILIGFMAVLCAFTVTFNCTTKRIEAFTVADDVVVGVLGMLALMGFTAVYSEGSHMGTGIGSPHEDTFIKQEMHNFVTDAASQGLASPTQLNKWVEKFKNGVIDTASTVSKTIFDFFKKHLYNWANSNSDTGFPGITHLPLGTELLNGRGITVKAGSSFTSTLKMTNISETNAKAYLIPLWPNGSNSKTMFVASDSKNCEVTLDFGNYTRIFKTDQSYGDTGIYYAVATNIGNTIWWDSSGDFNFGTYILPLHREINSLNEYIKKILENNDIDVDNSFTNRKYLSDESIDGFGIANTVDGTNTEGKDEVKMGWMTDNFTKYYDSVIDGTLGIDDVISKNKSYVKDKDKPIEDAKTIPDDIPYPVAVPDEETIKKSQNIKNNKSLITLFPFCIPYDVYYTFTLFCAEPKPLKIDFYLMMPEVDGHGFKIVQNKYTLDFSIFQTASTVLTYLMDILFVLSLALITRSLIRG